MTESENQREIFEEGALDLAIEAAFGDEAAPPKSDSVLQRLKNGEQIRRIQLREIEDRPGPVVRVSGAEKDEPPRQIGRYQIAGEMARGGVGSVLKARDVDLGRDVALKVLLGAHRDNEELTRRFFEEAQIGGQLQHPGIVPVHEIGLFADDRPYFAMKLVRGQTLAELLEFRADLEEGHQRFLGIFEQVCQTLAYAHTRGVIHRDVKPSNIMVGTFGEVQVMDWGMAKVLAKGGVADELRTTTVPTKERVVETVRSGDHGSASVAGSVMGTPAYMAPEQARGAVDDLDERSDVFGLGAMLCEILTGKPPYTGRTEEIYRKAKEGDLKEAFRRLDNCDADRALIELAKNCLAVDARERPRSAVVVSKRISSYLESLESRARTLALRATRARFKLAFALTILVALCIGGGGYLWIDSERREQRMRATETVNAAIAEAMGLRSQASSTEDLSIWISAQRELARALGLAREASDDALIERATRLHTELKRQVEDRQVVAELEALRQSQDSDSEELDESFREVFSRYGIDVDQLEPEIAAKRIRDSAIVTHLVLALDEWALTLQTNRRSRKDSWRRLFRITQIADDDPWRQGLRRAVEKNDRQKLQALSKELSLRTAEPSTLMLLASSLEDKRNWKIQSQEALSVWRKAQQLYPGHFWISFRLGNALLKNEQSTEALQFVRAAVALRPENRFARHLLGRALGDDGRIREAIGEFRDVISAHPDYFWPFHDCAELLGSNADTVLPNDLEGLLRTLRGIRDSEEKYDYDGFTRLSARLLFSKGDSREAILTLEEALRLRPPIVRRKRGRSNWLLDELEEYRSAVHPQLVSYASVDAFLSSDKEGSPDAAAYDFGKDGASRKAYLDGRLLETEGRYREAAVKFSEVVGHDQEYPEPFHHLAECLRASGQVAEAERVVRQALKREAIQRYADLWKMWAELSFKDLGRSAKEMVRVFPALPVEPSNGEYAHRRAQTDYGFDLRWLLASLAADRPVRIDCGGREDYRAADGTVWGRDRFFSSGSRPGNYASCEIPGTQDDPLYQTTRKFHTNAGYEIPVPNGSYEVTLHFSAVYSCVRKESVFDVLVEGKTVLQNYALQPEEGSATSDTRSVTTTVSDGKLDIDFVGRQDKPSLSGSLSGIAIVPLEKPF